MIGPIGSGFLVQHLGFNAAFHVFAGIAAAAAVLFVFFMPETRPAVKSSIECITAEMNLWLTCDVSSADLPRSGAGQGAGPAHGPGGHRLGRGHADAGYRRVVLRAGRRATESIDYKTLFLSSA